MTHHDDEREEKPVELTAREARQGPPGRPLLYVLIVLLAGFALGAAIAAVFS